jgi:hypothetical protein
VRSVDPQANTLELHRQPLDRQHHSRSRDRQRAGNRDSGSEPGFVAESDADEEDCRGDEGQLACLNADVEGDHGAGRADAGEDSGESEAAEQAEAEE